MSDPWNQWEGQTIDEKFPLRQFLGSTDHSAVFRTQTPEPQPKNAAIKFVFSSLSSADTQLALWKRAAQLSHPNLLDVFACGRCRLGDRELLYVVMEYAEENLAEILPQRALSPLEARDFLAPALDVLVYLHSKGLAHGHLKPSNLLAAQDCLKLSSDALLSIGAKVELHREPDGYDAPELPAAPVSAKADVWSLGATLVEALTQKPPIIAARQNGDPVVPDSLPQLFREIAGHALRRQEKQRWSIGDIAARLNPAPLAAAAAVASTAAPSAPATSISPLSVPLAKERAVPLAKLPAAREAPAYRTASSPARASRRSPFDYFVPAVLITAVIIGVIFAVPRMLNFQHSSPAASVAGEPAAPEAPAPAAERHPMKSNADTAPGKPLNRPAQTAPPAPAAAVLHTDSSTPVRPKSAGEIEGEGEVLDQVLPKPAPKALATIQGTVRVVVKVQVDAAGNVSDAELDSPGPSKYFAGLAENAARQWQFTGAESAGHGMPSAWLIRFEFSQSGVHAFSQQTAP